MKPLVVIPARSGSKGLPNKNIKLLKGKPLVHYTIEAAREIFPDKVICVSTDSPIIKACAELTGIKVPFLRPSELATDTASTYEVLRHAIDFYEHAGYYPDTLILLQATSPLRKGKHIREALELYQQPIDMVVSVKETNSNPYYSLFEENTNGFLKKSKEGDYTRRQDCPKVWEYNGAIYIISVASLKALPIMSFSRVKKYQMPMQDSIDIDTWLDFKMAEIILSTNFDNKTCPE
jgi:CMP-N,N'-diacetyllegionaminic acid synthase